MTKEQSTEPTIAQRTKVTLLKDGHTHDGRERKKGDVIEVTERQRVFLQKREFIAGDNTAATTAKKKDA